MVTLADQYKTASYHKYKNNSKEREFKLQEEQEEIKRDNRLVEQDKFYKAKYKVNTFEDLKADWKVRIQKKEV